MKIIEIVTTIEGAVHAVVLDHDKLIKVVSPDKKNLSKNIRRACNFVTPEDVLMDLAENFPAYLP